ncbi:MAG TPA: hypothetical protein DCX06_00480 [Opitutae bacterium]|nr:hypothetical protein [Opitutae bacterium]
MNPALRKLKRIYKRMSVREKLLCLLFCLVFIFIWADNWLDRTKAWNDSRKRAAVQLTTQSQWLERSDFYAQGLEQALERVDPAKTYSATQLSGKIDNLLRQASLAQQADMDPVRTTEGEIFNDYNLRVRLSRISIAQLISINKLLKAEAPYINIQSVRLSASRKNPEELDARMEINSFDLKDETIQN